jgi:hypothetical protein
MSQPDLASYQEGLAWPSTIFLIFIFPFLFVGLRILMVLELLFFDLYLKRA